jgi:hypothetical protein
MIKSSLRTAIATFAFVLVALGTAAAWSAVLSKNAKIVKITPSFVTEGIPEGTSIQFSAVAEDENAIRLSPQPLIKWSCSSPKMSISASGRLSVQEGCNGCGGEVRATVTNPDGSTVFGKVGVSGKVKR